MEALQKARMWISFTDKQDEYKALGKEKAELEASRQEKEKRSKQRCNIESGCVWAKDS